MQINFKVDWGKTTGLSFSTNNVTLVELEDCPRFKWYVYVYI